MTKKEILALNNSQLVALSLEMEARTVSEANFKSRGITQKTIKEYKWVVEELCNRFNLDLEYIVKRLGSSDFWEDEE